MTYLSKFSLNQATFLTAITPKFLDWAEKFSKNHNQKNQPLYLVPNINRISEAPSEESLIWWQKQIGTIPEHKRNTEARSFTLKARQWKTA